MLVLVGFDESAGGTRALQWALQLGRRGKGSVDIDAVRTWMYPSVPVDPLLAADEMDERVLSALHDSVADQRKGFDVDVRSTVLRGPATRALLAYVDERRPAMVVVGRRGDERVVRRVLGSVSRRLVEQASCPVVVVSGDDCRVAEGPRFVVGVDGSDDSLRALRWTADLAESLAGEIVMVNAVGKRNGPKEGGIEMVLAGGNEVLEEAEQLLHRPDVRHRSLTKWGDPRHALEEVADELEADAIVIGARGAGGLPKLVLGSVAMYLSQHAERPVAVVPSTWRPSTER